MTKNENDGKDESQVPCVFVGFVTFDLVWSLDSVKTLFIFFFIFLKLFLSFQNSCNLRMLLVPKTHRVIVGLQ